MRSQVDLVVHRRGSLTSIDTCYFEQPYKVIAMPRFGNKKTLDVMLMSSSPGLLSGDEFHLSLVLKDKSSLRILTQAYQRLYTSRLGIRQKQEIRLQEGASLVYAPHPVVPHLNSVYRNESEVHMAEGAELVWSEILTCGRSARGEVFEFASFRSRFSVFLEGKLLFLDNQCLDPQEQNLLEMGMMEGFSHQSLLAVVSQKADLKSLKSELETFLEDKVQGLICGISDLQHSGFVVRFLGKGAEELFDMNNALIEKLRPFLNSDES